MSKSVVLTLNLKHKNGLILESCLSRILWPGLWEEDSGQPGEKSLMD